MAKTPVDKCGSGAVLLWSLWLYIQQESDKMLLLTTRGNIRLTLVE